MRVLLVDDHAIVREGLKRVLASMGDGVQVGEATNAARALHLARKAEWDCALVDIALPGKTGLELLKELRRERPALPVLVLSMFSPRMATQIATNVGIESTRPPHETLSDREFTVMRMMASGVTPRDIAQQLSLSIKTVSTYRSRILQKLVLQNNAQLIAYAVKNNLVT